MSRSARSSWRRALRLAATALAGLLVLGLLVLGTGGPASAHASLLGTDPADGAVLQTTPDVAELTFDEPISVLAGGVTVYDAQGDAVASSATTRDNVLSVDLPDRLDDGTYVVSWRIVSADSHPVAGTLTFSIGRPSPEVAAPKQAETSGGAARAVLSVVQALGYLGLFLAVGLGLFLRFLLPGGLRLDRVHRLRRLAGGGAALGAVAGLLALPLGVVYQQGRGPAHVVAGDAWAEVSASGWIGLVMLLAGLVLVVAGLRTDPAVPAAPGMSFGPAVFTGAGAALALVAPALTGHTRGYRPEALLVTVDVLHVLAGSVWLGGLIGLAVTLPALAGRAAPAARLLAAFSTVAAVVLAALVGAGAVMAWRIVGSWGGLVETTYGRLLLAKIGLVAIAAGVAGWNRYVLLPRTRPDNAFTDRRASVVRVGRTAVVETALLVIALGVTGFLVNQSPTVTAATVPAGRTGVHSEPLGDDVKLLATVTPGAVGRNTVRIQLQDLTGEPYEPARPPTARLRSDGLDFGEVELVSEAAGTYRATAVIPRPGSWVLQVSLRVSRFENPVAPISFEVRR